MWRRDITVLCVYSESKAGELRVFSTEYLRKMKCDVCNQIFARFHVEPELPLKNHQVEQRGLGAWEAQFEL